MLRAYIANPGIKFAVFIHKAEMLSEDYRGGESGLVVGCCDVKIGKVACNGDRGRVFRYWEEDTRHETNGRGLGEDDLHIQQ